MDISSRKIVRFENDVLQEAEDSIVYEHPLTIHLNGEEFATMVCSPSNIRELTIGFWLLKALLEDMRK